MKNVLPWILSMLLMLVSFSAFAEESTGERIKEDAAEAGHVIKKDAVEAGHVIKKDAVKAGRVIKKGAVEVGHAVKKGAVEVGQAVKKGSIKAKRKVAVARCQDGAYSHTTQNTCNHHGGVKERLK